MKKIKKIIYNRTSDCFAEGLTTLVSMPLLWAGQQSQNYPQDVPQFIRWHLSDYADGMLLPTYFSLAAIIVTGRSVPKTAAALTVVIGISCEVFQASMPNRSFDFIDAGCYLLGALTYLAVHKNMIRPMQNARYDGNASRIGLVP